jgi:two-component system sensor histidine kinase/response regulator
MAALVLIVDDNAADRAGMASLLQSEGFEVAVARDGQDALQFLESARPGLILLDMVMHSGFDGWFFLGQHKHGIPVLIVTGLAFADDAWASSMGAQGLLKKPFDPDRLLQEVRKRLPG